MTDKPNTPSNTTTVDDVQPEDATQSSGASGTHADDISASAEQFADEAAKSAKSRGEELKAKAKTEAREFGEKAKSVAEAKAEEAKGYATSELDRRAESIRHAGREYGESSYQAHAADYLASNLHHAADVIRDRDVSSLLDDVSQFARRNPAVFLGGAALLGFAAARLLKASDRSPSVARFDQRQSADRIVGADDGFSGARYGAARPPQARPNGGYAQ
ncbi:MAG: hypothetical protein AAF919_01310 [Pseudomonadota bacterium]